MTTSQAQDVKVTLEDSSDQVIPMAPSTVTSLYVGDLHPSVTEQMLQEKFSVAGPLINVRVCRDALTRASLGYGYVNFQQNCDAKTALATMNFDPMVKKPIRLMWSQRDPTLRRSGAGNIFIKNLEESIDTKSIYDTFTMFGAILSCKVVVDDEGKSKGYGFIHFESQESADKAIEKVNGMELEGKAVQVMKFVPKSVRIGEQSAAAAKFTNVFVKNFGDDLDDDSLKALFAPFGPIKSPIVMKTKSEDGTEKSRGFGFVDFENHESAVQAIEKLNGSQVPGSDRFLVVARFQKKAERQAILKAQFEKKKLDRILRYQGTNLYVKNLDADCFVDDNVLIKTFGSYGKIASAKLMRDEEMRPKGFGFVCFEKAEDATKATIEMNGKMIGSKPLYVALAQNKEVRKKQLEAVHQMRLESNRLQQQQQRPMYASSAGVFNPNMQNMRAFMPMPPNLSGGMQQRFGPYIGGGFNQMAAAYTPFNRSFHPRMLQQ